MVGYPLLQKSITIIQNQDGTLRISMNDELNNNNHSDIVKTSLDQLRDLLASNTHLLRAAPTEALRRHACNQLLDSFAASILEVDEQGDADEASLAFYTSVWSTICGCAGLFDERVRHVIVRLLHNIHRLSTVRQLLLDCLPMTIASNGDDKVYEKKTIRTLEALLRRDNSSLIPIFVALRSMPLSEDGKEEVVKIALEAIIPANNIEMEAILQTLLRHVTTEQQIESGWTTLRKKQLQADPTRSTYAAMLLYHFQNSDDGHWLGRSFTKHIDSIGVEDTVLLDDVVVLVVLGKYSQFSESVQCVMDKWLANDLFPFVQLRQILEASPGELNQINRDAYSIHRQLQGSLQELVVFLVLSPVRVLMLPSGTTESIIGFILFVYGTMEPQQHHEMILTLLSLSPTASRLGAPTHEYIILSETIYSLLNRFIDAPPTELECLTDLFTERLQSSSFDLKESQHLCRILARLWSRDSSLYRRDKIVNLLRTLLLSPASWNADGPTATNTSILKGLVLAIAVLQSRVALLAINDQCTLKVWVVRSLLPVSRFAIDPTVGRLGLEFLRLWIGKQVDDRKTVFEDIKMMISNTGLIQRAEQHRKSHSVLSHFRIPEHFLNCTGEQTPSDKSVLFCVAYFIRRSPVSIVYWEEVVRWIYNLVDSYLDIGRELTPNGWNPNGWIRAGIEFPCFPECFDELGKELQQFDEYCHAPVAGNPNMDIKTALDERNIEVLKESLQLHSLSLLVAAALSSAVLKNSYEYYFPYVREGHNISKTTDLRNMLKLQLLKLYDLRHRIQMAVCLIHSLQQKMKDSLKRRKLLSKDARDQHTITPDCSVVTDLETSASILSQLELSIFCSGDFFPYDAVWECLIDEADERFVQRALTDSCSIDRAIKSGLLQLKVELAAHIVSSCDFLTGISDDMSAQKNHCSRMCHLLIGTLPLLRKEVFVDKPWYDRDTSLVAVTTLTVSYIQLLSMLVWGTCQSGNKHIKFEVPSISRSLQWLKVTDNERVAGCILELLAVLALQSQNDVADQVVDASWKALHTIYTQQDASVLGNALQEPILVSVIKSKEYKWSDNQGVKLWKYYGEALPLMTGANMASCRMLVHHFILLQFKHDHLTRHMHHLVQLVAEISKCAGMIRNEKNKKAAPSFVFPFLSMATCSAVFDITLEMLVWVLSATDPCEQVNGSPYKHILTLTMLYRKLLDVFCRNYEVFPRKKITEILQVSHRAIMASVSLPHRCCEWRGRQPTQSSLKGHTSLGNLSSLKELVDRVASDLIGGVFCLCDFLQTLAYPSILVKANVLRQTADNALRLISCLAATYNWPAPAFDRVMTEDDYLLAFGSANEAENCCVGFHERSGGDSDDDNNIAINMDSIDEASSDGSFGAAGDWGSSL